MVLVNSYFSLTEMYNHSRSAVSSWLRSAWCYVQSCMTPAFETDRHHRLLHHHARSEEHLWLY